MNSTMPTASSPSDNTTAHHNLGFPRDADNRLLFLIRDINFGVALAYLVLGLIVVINALKSLSEIANSPTPSAKPNYINYSWLVSKLKCKYAAPLVIFANGSILIVAAVLCLVMYSDVGGEAVCDPIQRVFVILYVASLWTTYIIFEIRRISTGSENVKGVRYVLMQVVRCGTFCMPLFFVVSYYYSSGIYLADVRHCIIAVDPLSSTLLGVIDGVLSMGHIMLFIFALRQKSNFKIAAIGSRVRFKTAIAPSSFLRRNVSRINRNIAVAHDDAKSTIQAIARRNLRIALVTVTSTAITVVITSWANLTAPPQDSPTARSYFYLAHVSTLAAGIDVIINTVSILIMTSSWQPACLKKLTARINATAGTKKKVATQSDVSSLGGGV